ncbi:MAG: rhomboid family intramembrane serine protease [Acidimicrobiales bacterium]
MEEVQDAVPETWNACYRHPDRRAGVSCQRCDRPICPACMSQASVGFHCPECVRRGGQKVITPRSLQVRPWLTQVLIGINVVVFLLGIGLASVSGFGSATFRGGLNGPDVADGEWWRLITSGFLHANLFHLAFNMAALWILGSQLESALGRVRYAIVYFGSLLGGALGALLLSPNVFTVGASGAIFGVMGAAAALHVRRGLSLMATGLGTLLVINLAITFLVPRISIGGHLGGLVIGFLTGYLIAGAPAGSRRASWAVAAGLVLAVALLGAGIVLADVVSA